MTKGIIEKRRGPQAKTIRATEELGQWICLNDCIAKDAPICYGILKPGAEYTGGVPVIKVRNFSNGKLKADEVIHTSPEIDSLYRRSRLRAGDILLAIRGSTGDVTTVPYELEGANITQDSARIRISDDQERDYVYYALKSPTVQNHIRFHTIGQAVKGINIGDVRKIPIFWPTRKERSQISKYLSSWSRAIELTQDLITAKQERRKWLMGQLLTGTRRLSQFGDPWRRATIGEMLRERKRPVRWSDEHLYRLISLRRRSGGVFQREELYGSQIKTKKMHIVKEGDFVISKMQIVHGASGLVTAEFDGLHASDSYIILRARIPNLFSINFFNWLSKLPLMYHHALFSSYGVHIEKMTFNLADYLKRHISIPSSVEEQRAIVEVLETADRELDLLRAQLDALREQKKGLMQQLLTGKIRVKVDEEITRS